MTQPQEPTMLWSDAQIRKVIFDAWKLHFCTYHQDWLVDIVKTVRDDEVTNALAAANAEVERLKTKRDQWKEDFINLGEVEVGLIKENKILRAELQRLKEQQWQPLPDGEYEGQHKDHSVIVEGEWLTIREPDWDTPGEFLDTSIALYDNIRLCRLAAQEQEGDK